MAVLFFEKSVSKFDDVEFGDVCYFGQANILFEREKCKRRKREISLLANVALGVKDLIHGAALWYWPRTIWYWAKTVWYCAITIWYWVRTIRCKARTYKYNFQHISHWPKIIQSSGAFWTKNYFSKIKATIWQQFAIAIKDLKVMLLTGKLLLLRLMSRNTQFLCGRVNTWVIVLLLVKIGHR